MRKLISKLMLMVLSVFMLAGVANAQFFFYRYREHATDCTALTDGKKYDLCHELDDKTFYSCVPTVGDCSGSEWELIEANLRSDPSACTAGQYVTDIGQDGTLTCGQVAFSQLSGSATDAQVPNTITIDLASTATALAANGANCSAGQFPLGVDASGAVETCSTSLSGNASTATALAANGSNCSAGSGAGGVDASGAAESCIDYYSTLAELQTAVTSDFHNLGGTDDDVPEAADYSNLTGGAGIANSPTGTITTASTEASFLTDGDASALTCGSSAQGKMQVMDSGILQYCDGATTSVIQYAALANSSGVATSATALAANGANCSAGNYPLGVDASGAVETCTADDDVPESGDFTNLSGTSPITVSAGAVSIANAAADGSTKGAASFDSTDFSASSGNISLGASPTVTTQFDIGGNSTAAGILKLLEDTDDGTNYLTFKTAARASNLDLIWNITASTCTGDGNGGNLTINGSNEIVCSADDGGAGSGDIGAVGDCPTGDCFTGASGTLLQSNTDLIMELDNDNNGTESFQVKDGADTIVAEVAESGIINTLVGLDAIGAVDLDYGSADVTDHTFVTDGTGDSEVVLPDASIGATELDADSVSASELNATGVESELEAVLDLDQLQGQISDTQIADGAVDGGVGGEIADGSVTADDLGADSVSSSELNASGVEAELEAVIDLADLQEKSIDSLTGVGTAGVTAGNLLIADGTNYQGVAMSGDITTTSAGVTSIGNDKVVDADLSITERIFLPVQAAKITGAFVVRTPTGGDATTQGAQIDAGDGNWRLLFDATTDEGAVWQFRLPDYWSAHSEVNIFYTMTSATTLEVEFEVDVMCITDGDSADIGTAGFAGVAVGSATVPGTAGHPDEVSVTVTDDSCSAGDIMFLYLSTDADDATNDDATGDREIVGVEYEFTR